MRVSRIVNIIGSDAVVKASKDASGKFNGVEIKFYKPTPRFQSQVGKVADEFLGSDLPKTENGIAEAIKKVFNKTIDK